MMIIGFVEEYLTGKMTESCGKNVNFYFTGCKPEQQMMYAGSKNRLVQAAELTKVTMGCSRAATIDWFVVDYQVKGRVQNTYVPSDL